MSRPDFLIIGTARSGTTTLHTWLAGHPAIYMYPGKEPHFFSQDGVWARGLGWYGDLFAPARPGQLLGEGSTSYSDPEYSERAAERIARVIPDARLIYLLRHPVERLRSDLEHQIRQGRELRPVADAAADPDAPHALRSHYFACLQPFARRFDRAQICVIRFEDLVAAPYAAWGSVLAHLGVEPVPAPATVHNAGAEQPDAAWLMRRLRRSPLGPLTRRLPASVRTAVKRSAGRVGPRRAPVSSGSVPDSVTVPIWDDIAALERWLGAATSLWPGRSPNDCGGETAGEQDTGPV